jgi:hypothetical protein
MFGSLPQPAYMPCPDCGESVARAERDDHVCTDAQRTTYARRVARIEAERFDGELTRWLSSPAGRFAVFYAERQRRAA